MSRRRHFRNHERRLAAVERIDVRRRQIPVKKPALGRWTLQVDNQKTYSAMPDSVFKTLIIQVTQKLRQTLPR